MEMALEDFTHVVWGCGGRGGGLVGLGGFSTRAGAEGGPDGAGTGGLCSRGLWVWGKGRRIGWVGGL